MKTVVTIDKKTGVATYDVQEAEGTQCMKATEHIRSTYNADPKLKDDYFKQTVDLLNG